MGDIRFDCRFCNKPVTVDPKYAGKKTKCPSCKNPVVVPGQAGTMAASLSAAEQDSGLQRVSGRSVGGGGSGLLTKLIRLVILGVVGYGAWLGYGWFQGQEKKSLAKLLAEMTDGTLGNEVVIRKKVMDVRKEDGSLPTTTVNTLGKHKKSSSDRVRSVVIELLGGSKNKKAISPLWTMLKDDKDADLRRAAALALGDVGWEAKDKKLIGRLIGRMEREKDDKVKGGIRTALKVMTANYDHHKVSQWKSWWAKAESGFTFGDKGRTGK